MRLGRFSGSADLPRTCSRFPVLDVFSNTAAEEKRLLQDHGYLLTKRTHPVTSDILAVNQNSSIPGIVETQQQIQDGRFPGAAAANQRNRLAGQDRKAQILKYGRVGRITERDMIERDLAFESWRDDGPSAIAHPG